MEINYFDLSGGINQSSTKTELGVNTKPVYWSDAQNIEILNNKGIIKQKGNSIFAQIPESEEITGMHEMEFDNIFNLIVTTISGKIYIYSPLTGLFTLVDKTLHGIKVKFVPFLRGILVASESDPMFYIKNQDYEVVNCNLKDTNNVDIIPNNIAVYKGRVFCSSGATLYYSALGTYDDFGTENDAGYINEFHTDTSDITGIHAYKDYLAIYKKERIYLLAGTTPTDFAVYPFADKGTKAKNSILNVDNKQYFLSNGIYALEQVGELNQIRLGSEISLNIKNTIENLDNSRISETFALHYHNKHQMWFFFPIKNNLRYNIIWINDYLNKAWYKRVLPQKITCACSYNSYILTADEEGNIYREDFGESFNGSPINFYWKSSFFSLNNVHHRKIIDEFYFILDGEYNNNFNFSVYKDYDVNNPEDNELIYSSHYNQLVWADDEEEANNNNCWALENAIAPVWAINADTIEKAEICGSCFSVQLCIDGKNSNNDAAIIGLQFREIYNDD
ncbi:hypothetical protein J6G99_05635 [bacterium]|nr:hypothetical protein [bacterium]